MGLLSSTNPKWRSLVSSLMVGCAFLASTSQVPAQQTDAPEGISKTLRQPERNALQNRQEGVDAILQRLQGLESQVAQFQAEAARLRAELLHMKQGRVTESTASSGVPGVSRSGPALSTATAQQMPSASQKSEADDWAEPEVVKTQEGRDDEARRRLTVVETQLRKVSAAAAKEEEEEKQKVQFAFSGKYKAQINSRHNFELDNPLQQWRFDNATFVDHRFQLGIDATYEAFLARLVLDKGNFVFDWKEDSEGTLERWGEFQTVNSALVRELFAQYTGPFMARVGRQNWIVGNSIALEGPMDSLLLQYPVGQLPWGQTTVGAGYLSVAGGWRSYAEFAKTGPPAGSREEVLYASNKLDGYYLGLDIRPSRATRIQPYLLKVADGGGPTDADLNLDKDFSIATTPRDGAFEPLWAGISVSADRNPWKLDMEAVWLSGDYTKDRQLAANALFVQIERGFGKVGSLKNLSAGFKFGRGSGNGTNDSSVGTMRNFNGLFLCRDRHKFGNIFSEDIRAGYYFWDSSLANITYARLEATLEPVKNVRLTPSITKIWTTEQVFEGRGPVFDWSKGAATSVRTTNDVGWEIDLNVSYPLLQRLEGFLSLGYFKPGAVYARPDGRDPGPAYEATLGAEFSF